MGVVVSAVASGIVQNIQADLVKAREQQEGKGEAEIVKGRQQESRAESPGRIQTPGYPPVILPPPPAPASSAVVTASQANNDTQSKEGTDKRGEEGREGQEQEEPTVEVVKEEEVVNSKSPSFLDNIFSTLRLTSPTQTQTQSPSLPQPATAVQSQLEPGEEKLEPVEPVEPVKPIESVQSVGPGGFFPADSLPVVSLLPTLTEEITISLSHSHNSNAGWFRRNYTSIDTVQKIYGTHPRYSYSQRRGGVTRPRR